MGTLKTRNKEYVGELRKHKPGKNKVYTQVLPNKMKKFIPIRKE